MRAVLSILILGVLTACAPHDPVVVRPGGIISIDYCADQMLLKLAKRERVSGVSKEIDLDKSFAAPLAVNLPRVRANIEDILALRPSMVVASYAGSPMLDAQLARVGVRVVRLGYAAKLEDIPPTIRAAARQFEAKPAGEATVAEFRAKLRGAAKSGPLPTLLYLTPGGVTTGAGSLIDDAIQAAGYRNFESRTGWHSLPLETMAMHRPDAVLTAFFDNRQHDQDAWSSARHPLVARSLAGKPVLAVPGSAVSCGNWLIGDVVKQLSEMRRRTS